MNKLYIEHREGTSLFSIKYDNKQRKPDDLSKIFQNKNIIQNKRVSRH